MSLDCEIRLAVSLDFEFGLRVQTVSLDCEIRLQVWTLSLD